MSTIHTRIDVNDIVGKQFGGFVVVEYSHKEIYKRKDKMGSRHWYVIECLLCGRRKLECRNKIRTKQSVCFECRKKI